MLSRTLLALAAVSLSAIAQTPVSLRVDATDVARRVIHVNMVLPATALLGQWD